jgi:hydrogenase nickel incorporation protein HypB
MCQESGCHNVSEAKIVGHTHDRRSGRLHADEPALHEPGNSTQTIDLNLSLLDKNDRLAEQNRSVFRAKKLLVLNVLSSPGSGKTTFIRETAARLAGKLRVGVIVGDLATDNDAERLRVAGIPVVQITTGTVCHLEADMVARAAGHLDLEQLDVLVIENVGNLVCPADFDLGEDLRVVLLSTTEGEDKPLKYPPMFHSAHVAVVTKGDLAAAAGFDRSLALSNLRRISHHAQIFELSAKTGDGMAAWLEFLVQKRATP